MFGEDDVRFEEEMLKQVKSIVDASLYRINSLGLYGREAWDELTEARRRILEKFPDKEETFDMVYLPRFKRIIWKNMLQVLED